MARRATTLAGLWQSTATPSWSGPTATTTGVPTQARLTFSRDRRRRHRVQLAKLTAADAAAGDSFGYSVAIDGNAIVVGANGNQRAGVYTGSAYVFRTHDGGATYIEVARIRAVDAAGRRGLQSSSVRLVDGASSHDARD